MRKLARVLATGLFCILALFAGLGLYYWVGWPFWMRAGMAGATLVLLPLLWFLPGRKRVWRRGAALTVLLVFLVGYANKQPVDETYVPLHSEVADVTWLDGSRVEISNFRDAVHPIGAPAAPVWTTRQVDLDKLTGAQFVLQPFGPSLATVHVMTSFFFAGEAPLAVSFEARRTSWDKFDPLAGFFKHDQLYAVIGTERDLFWKRLAHIPPNDLYFFELTGSREDLRAYLKRLLEFVAEIHDRPQFYSTVSESCFTTLLKLSPRIEATVPWYDPRRWVPGASVTLFQELGLIDSSVPAAQLIADGKLPQGILPPWDFADASSWSAYIRHKRDAGAD
jgi:hypothetical protein